MALLKSLYLFEIFALQLVSLFTVLSADVSEAPDARVITDVSKQRSWSDALQVRDVRRHVARRKAPRFMMELYEENIRNPAILQGNIVRSFPAQPNGAFHFFNLTSFGHLEKITKAEFRWFRRARTVLPGHHFYRIDLYEALDSRVKPWRGNLILSRVLSVYTEGWEVFNITHTVTKWLQNSSTNSGILVASTVTLGHWLETSVKTVRETGYEENDAYLVIYSDDGRRSSGKGDLGEGIPPSGPNTDTPLEFLEFKNSLRAAVRRRRNTHKRAAENSHAAHCQRTSLYVDFVKLGWSGWIISPRGYNAYHCTGSCPFPLSGSLHATNHAIVQSIVSTLKLSNKVGRPCCVPDNLQPISLLYFDDEENVVLKQYDDMVASSCGCH
ncbi:bone morphogenetic protein 2-like [Ictalurus punctatus]|uniref:Bone morphogenetic protein 2-like n=1 Tax=Ictalurus punctatus TaxID=7998 RepID=A0A9F7RE73_ICTPU|nr:bone morphogenetic protein 2-like [Ictalurus punctatus]